MRDGGEDARTLRRRSLEVLRRQHPEGHGGDGQLGAPEEHVERVPPVAVEDDGEVPRHRPAADRGASSLRPKAGMRNAIVRVDGGFDYHAIRRAHASVATWHGPTPLFTAPLRLRGGR